VTVYLSYEPPEKSEGGLTGDARPCKGLKEQRMINSHRRNGMNRSVMVLILSGIFILLFCYPALAAYAKPYYSHAYQNLSPDDKRDFDSSMKAGDALYAKGEYSEAVASYNRAWGICDKDYTVQAAIGQTYLEIYKKDKNPFFLQIARNSFIASTEYLQNEHPGGYEENDLMAKIRTSQAEMYRLEGNEDAARLSEQEAADYRNKANQTKDSAGIPLSPWITVLGLGIAGTFVIHRIRDD
jgi:tetratricopeptide (TPR) repeat protein